VPTQREVTPDLPQLPVTVSERKLHVDDLSEDDDDFLSDVIFVGAEQATKLVLFIYYIFSIHCNAFIWLLF